MPYHRVRHTHGFVPREPQSESKIHILNVAKIIFIEAPNIIQRRASVKRGAGASGKDLCFVFVCWSQKGTVTVPSHQPRQVISITNSIQSVRHRGHHLLRAECCNLRVLLLNPEQVFEPVRLGQRVRVQKHHELGIIFLYSQVIGSRKAKSRSELPNRDPGIWDACSAEPSLLPLPMTRALSGRRVYPDK